MKILTPESGNALAAGSLRRGFIAEIEHPAGTMRVWSGLGSLRWNGLVWKGLAQMGRVSGLGQTAEIRTKETQYQLIGASVDTTVEKQISDAGISGNLARCWFSLFDPEWKVIPDPIQIDQTILDRGSINHEPTSDLQMAEILTLHGQSAIFNFGSPSRLRATNEEQQQAFPGDTGLDRLSTEVADKEIVWTFD